MLGPIIYFSIAFTDLFSFRSPLNLEWAFFIKAPVKSGASLILVINATLFNCAGPLQLDQHQARQQL